MKKSILLLGLLQATVSTNVFQTEIARANSNQGMSYSVSDDSFQLIDSSETETQYFYDLSTVYNNYEYYYGNTFVKLDDRDNGFDKKPISEYYKSYVYGENNNIYLDTYRFCALYKCPFRQYKTIVANSQVVNSSYEDISINIQDSSSGAVSSSIESSIGAGFGGFVEAGVKAGLCTEFGMEVGSSFGASFVFTPAFKAQSKTFNINVYEVQEYFLVITYTPEVIFKTKKSGFLFWEKRWKEFDYVLYRKSVYLLKTPAEVVFEYTVR
ncbi:MAG: hypothetical protein MJ228_00465 [Bacilli bacterium]|nr:hypothetical protein [Bacilli bacterium]